MKRRAFLRSAGTALALPFFESLLPRKAWAQAAPPKRLFVFYVPNGIHMPSWTPTAAGSDYELSPILTPLEPHKDKLLVLSNLANRPAAPDGPGDHAAGVAGFLTATHVRKTEGFDIRNGKSMDQVAAEKLGANTRFPSLQLGTDGGGNTGDCDFGYSCAYLRNISWAGTATPLPKEIDPRAAFDRLFQGADPEASAAEIERKRRYKLSVLDFVREDAQGLASKLGKTDRAKLDEYLTGVRELERRLEGGDLALTCGGQGTRPEDSADFRVRVRAMLDLSVLAFQCDLTRVITFMLGHGLYHRVYDFLGVRDSHHTISHHQGLAENFAQLEKINTWEIEQLAYLLSQMKSVSEGDGSLLDNSAVFFSSEVGDGNAHTHDNLPVLLAGGLGGTLSTGRHIRYDSEQKMSELFIAILLGLGVNVSHFGDDGQAPLTRLG